jgi:glutathione synthase/RimK-type ligase-like ATP-grasp enzyme
MLLILTSEKDLAADYLIVYLQRNGLPFHRLNAESYHQQFGTFRLGREGVTRTVRASNGTLIDFAQIRAVWYRRAIHPQVSPRVVPAQRRFVAGETRHFWAGLVLSSDALWVNPIDKVSVGELKLVQLELADRLGFNVPRTLVSRDPGELREFVRSEGAVICKPVYHGLLVTPEGRSSAYTRRITLSDLGDENAIDVGPVLLQAEVPRRADVRVTFVGNAVFAVRITSNDASLVDWRVPGTQLAYEVFAVPDDITGKCRTMLESMGLHYGAFDFIEDTEGRLVFLEINPTGEWAWLEEQLNLPFREAFARLFYGQ